ncbi:MAG TPA: type II toxin-antitoxin system VapC family toxin [Terracidiphilus sp.]|nr:type II toxin-antitoxin system VapC family toxin [Terracidiphilus sp.]
MSEPAEYLLDTNVLSELRKKKPDPGVVRFVAGCDESTIHISVLTLGELRKGVAQKRRSDDDAAQVLEQWVDGLESNFTERMLSVDAETARIWGEWSADRSRPVIDTLLAATAARRGLTLVTRNTRDMRGLDVTTLNPWKK